MSYHFNVFGGIFFDSDKHTFFLNVLKYVMGNGFKRHVLTFSTAADLNLHPGVDLIYWCLTQAPRGVYRIKLSLVELLNR